MGYTVEKNVQMLIYLLKKHNISRVIASPGTTNITLVASMQQDSFFTIYSAADERSAAYMACGMAAETGEPVVISCTGATASRNYIPGLTEAFYRKLPILAVTSTQHTGRIGQLNPQVIDRSVIQKDIAVLSVHVPLVYGKEDEWDCNIKINRAILALWHRGGGPVHINLVTNYSRDFSVENLPIYRAIYRIERNDEFPRLNARKVGIFVGAHSVWNEELTKLVDAFCEKYNGVVFCDHTSNYYGKYRVQFNLVAGQSKHLFETQKVDLLIDMGEMSGAYMKLFPEEVWRVNADGEIRDTWKKLKYMFDMKEKEFFDYYVNREENAKDNVTYYEECKRDYNYIYSQIKELPFSNIWTAMVTSKKINYPCFLHLGILNSLRSWNFFEISKEVICSCNTGGFGIDGIISTTIGASLATPSKIHYCIVGDLAFFYDLNSIANHNVRNNLRILLINNGGGIEFKNYNHFAAQFDEKANEYIAAMGHYGNKSRNLVKHYAQDLGFEYLSACSKEEYLEVIDRFTMPSLTERPMLLEVFTDYQDESEALKYINHIVEDNPTVVQRAKECLVDIIGEKRIEIIRDFMKG